MNAYRIVIGAAAILSLVGRADPIVSWTDDQGVTHYTDDPSRIPEKNKPSAKRFSGPRINEVVGEEEPDTGQESSTREAAPDEKHWRQRFHDAYARIKSLERQIEEDKGKVEDESGLPILHKGKQYQGPKGPAVVADDEFLAAKRRLARNRELLRRAKLDLENLDIEAANQSVPQEWRVP